MLQFRIGMLFQRCSLMLAIAALMPPVCLAQSNSAAIQHEFVRSYDGTYLPVAWRKPPGDGRFPAILVIHGGVGGHGPNGLIRYVNGRVPSHFLEQGYVVMATDYRRYHFGEDEIQDALAAYRKLQSFSFVDEKRVAVLGGSHGGYLAQMLASRIAPPATVSFAGLSDIEGMFQKIGRELYGHIKNEAQWRDHLLTHGERALPGFTPSVSKIPGGNIPFRNGSAGYEVALELGWRYTERPKQLQALSPMNNASTVKGPVLYLVGGEDPLRRAGKEWVEAVRAHGGDATYSEYSGMKHSFYWGKGESPPQQFHTALSEVTAFFDLRLKGKETTNRKP